jgi:hypothetical protein
MRIVYIIPVIFLALALIWYWTKVTALEASMKTLQQTVAMHRLDAWDVREIVREQLMPTVQADIEAASQRHSTAIDSVRNMYSQLSTRIAASAVVPTVPTVHAAPTAPTTLPALHTIPIGSTVPLAPSVPSELPAARATVKEIGEDDVEDSEADDGKVEPTGREVHRVDEDMDIC